LPKNKPLAIIYIVHGLGGHSGRFDNLAKKIIQRNIAVIGIDLRGHGRSKGKRGHVKQINDFLNDIHAALVHGCKLLPDKLPKFIYGNSMGGTLALEYLFKINADFNGVILTAPWFKLSNPPKKISRFLIYKLSMLWPGYILKSKVRSNHLRSDIKRQEEARKDSLVHKKISARLFKLIYELGTSFLVSSEKKTDLPIMIFHGENDPVTDSIASKKFYLLHKDQCELHILKNTLHEVHMEEKSGEMIDKIVQWINLCIESREFKGNEEYIYKRQLN
jgi:alpha-beta hydrolase superfamily lysophospholipase